VNGKRLNGKEIEIKRKIKDLVTVEKSMVAGSFFAP